MLIADLPIGTKLHRPLARNVLAVLSRREDGWCVYVGGVPGESHDTEWHEVARTGSKQDEDIARAIFAGYDPGDLSYAR